LLNEPKVAHRNRRLLFWLPNCFFTLATPLHSVLFSCPYAPSKNEGRTPLLLPLDTDNPSHATTLYPTLTLTLTLTVKLSTLTLTRGRLSAAAVRQVSGGGGGGKCRVTWLNESAARKLIAPQIANWAARKSPATAIVTSLLSAGQAEVVF